MGSLLIDGELVEDLSLQTSRSRRSGDLDARRREQGVSKGEE